MRRPILTLLASALALAIAAPAAWGHAAFLGSTPQPGLRLEASPRQVTLRFTEPLNRRLATARIVAVRDGSEVRATVTARSSRKLGLSPSTDLRRGAYRVQWHSVSTLDGHALEGSFSFGVRSAAAGGEYRVQQSPLARGGWLRVVARVLLYAALLLFAGALLLRVLLGTRERSWLTPAVLAETPDVDLTAMRRREASLVGDLGALAVGSTSLATMVEAADAAQGLSPPALADYLLTNLAGLGRIAVVAFTAIALAVARRHPRAAAVAVSLGLGSVAASGHASSASPRAATIAVGWIHLLSGALWLGGIVLFILVWGAALQRAGRPVRLAVARHVLPALGRIALPAFVLVCATGLVSLLVQLGTPSDLWQTAYGRVLLVKIALVGLIAVASWWHALRLRPWLMRATEPPTAIERRHWRLLRTEPLLGLGVVAAVALLASFPLPPRELGEANDALAAAPTCAPCPLPAPRADELPVADAAGSRIVAGWLRRRGARVSGTVRVLDYRSRPVRASIVVQGARQRPCGPGCRRFVSTGATVRAAVAERGRRYVATLPARWQRGANRRARALLESAQRRMRGLRSVRMREHVSSGPGSFANTVYRLKAPDRMTYGSRPGETRTIVIGGRQWFRPTPDAPWQAGRYGDGSAFSTRRDFRWTIYARAVRMLRTWREDGRRMAELALMDPGTPVWTRLTVALGSGRVVHERMLAPGHFMTMRYDRLDTPIRIEPPEARNDD